MPVNLFESSRAAFNYTLTIPQNIVDLFNRNAAEERPAIPAVNTGCLDGLIEKVKNFFSPLIFWISQISPSSDPALLSEWDKIVEKETDPSREQVLADAFLRAASKTGINPSFDHVLVIDRKRNGEGTLFDKEGHYCDLRGRAHEFNTPATLVVVADNCAENVVKNHWDRYSGHRICSNGRHPMDQAVIFSLNDKEIETLENERMPLSLLKFLRKHDIDMHS